MKWGLSAIGFLLSASFAAAFTVWVDDTTNVFYVANGVTNRIATLEIIPPNDPEPSCSDYPITTNSTFDVEVTRPTQEELGRTMGCATVQTRTKFKQWLEREHNLDGTHAADFLTLGDIADGLIPSSKLDTATQAVLSNAVALAALLNNRTVTGAKRYVAGLEQALPSVPLSSTVTNILAPFGTLTVPTNQYAQILVQGEVELTVTGGQAFDFPLVAVAVGTNGVSYGRWNSGSSAILHAGNPHRKYVRLNLLFPGGQTEAQLVEVRAASDRGSPNVKTAAVLRWVRVVGIP